MDSNINSLVWDEMEQLKYEATPMFMVVAGKQQIQKQYVQY